MLIEAIVPLYSRHENTFPIVERLLVSSSRRPDFVTFLGEEVADCDAVFDAIESLYELELLDDMTPYGVSIVHHPTPRDGDSYALIPYSNKINYALDCSRADAVFYVDNGSMLDPQKVSFMASALEQNPGWDVVYCSQERSGFRDELHLATDVIPDGHGQVNFTQVMHRVPVEARWTTDMQYANPDLADALFWRDLASELGPMYPVGGSRVLDVHHMPSPAANGC